MLKEAGIKVPDMEATVVRKSFSVQGPNGVGSTMQILSYTRIVNMYRLCVCACFWCVGMNAEHGLIWLPRWHTDQIYVNHSTVTTELATLFKQNGKGGTTVTVKRHGGWSKSYFLAKQLAGWACGP